MIRDVLLTAFATCAALVAAQTTTLQAESATLSGVTVATAVAGFTG
jgi:mannan endo-1,4-beta-mannosidase